MCSPGIQHNTNRCDQGEIENDKSAGNWFPPKKTGHWHFRLVGVQVKTSFCISIISLHFLSCREFSYFLQGVFHISCREWFQDLTFRSWWNCSGYTGVRFKIIFEQILFGFRIIFIFVESPWADLEFVEPPWEGAAVQDHAEEPHSRLGSWLWRAITKLVVWFLSKAQF